MRPSNEFCIKFLEASGWLANHDKQIREEVITEISKEMKLLYKNEYESKIRTDTINECIRTLAKSEDTVLSDKQYYTLMELKEKI